MGPTASGKTALAVELAQAHAFEIISVDSALIYKGMDIGTAKPDAATLEEIPHHLIDIRDPVSPYSAADFRVDALRLIGDIAARDKIPLLTGGTMLYFKALKQGLAKLPAADAEVRAKITGIANEHGWAEIHRQLALVDPVAAARIHMNDPQRLQRALEVYEISGRCITEWQQVAPEPCPFNLLEIAVLPPDRSVLHTIIADRFNNMLERGLVAEVENLYQRADLNADIPAMRAVGYRQVWAYLDGQISYDSMIEKAIIATRQLAKRQYTWLRSWAGLKKIAVPSSSEALKIIRSGSILD
ncbi:MAG: tRNA (adenosine(37)-N6)-dimethylallyltransferase MiaA [Pseudomonadales bacterium]|nr:tRNA (adenosine(37)-N6)-dimethylallyltransferase MiaA [Pseudomonadales bacterium]